jgi:hypothetical protein
MCGLNFCAQLPLGIALKKFAVVALEMRGNFLVDFFESLRAVDVFFPDARHI